MANVQDVMNEISIRFESIVGLLTKELESGQGDEAATRGRITSLLDGWDSVGENIKEIYPEVSSVKHIKRPDWNIFFRVVRKNVFRVQEELVDQ